MKVDKRGIKKLKTSLANIALFLSIFAVLFPLALPTVKASGTPTTWYVDDVVGEGPGNPPENFTSIQAAVSSILVDPGDIIFVWSGVYEENVLVDKECLNITGESRDNTTIDGGGLGTVITISASLVNVTGFTIKNGHNGIESISVGTIYNNIKIDDNRFEGNDISGIYLQSSENVHIVNNEISSSYWGIHLYKSDKNRIENNIIDDPWDENVSQENPPARIFVLYSDNNYIYNNPWLNNSEYGIRLSYSNWNYINNSYITNNTFGIRLENSNNNTIHQNNRINNNSIDGIYLNGTSGSHNNKIIGNNISYNNETGVRLSDSNSNIVCSNDILFNEEYGISLVDAKDNTICNNTANNNTIYGLYIDGDYRNNITENNTFNGGNISYIYGVDGSPSQLNDSVQNKNLTAGINVTNVGKITFVECSYFYVAYNSVSNATKGIFLYDSNNITLNNNTIYDIDEYGLYIEGDYRNYIAQNNTVNGEKIYYYYNVTGNQTDLIEVEIPEVEQPLNASKVSNVGKISVVDSGYLLIKNNNLSNGSFGIFLYGSQELTLWNNTIADSEEVGLYITEGYHHYIEDNNSVKWKYKWDDWENIYYYTDKQNITVDYKNLTERRVSNVGKLSFINCNNITIKNNTLRSVGYSGTYTYGAGIFLYSSTNCTMTENELLSNKHGIRLIKSNNNKIINSRFGHKDSIYFDYSNNNSITKNNFSNLGGLGPMHARGIVLSNSNDVEVTNNTMRGSGISSGIYIMGSCFNIYIYNNSIYGLTNGVYGRNLENSKLTIEKNYISNIGMAIAYLSGCNPSTKILKNTILNVSGLGAIYLMNCSPWVEGNNISNASADGIDVYHEDSAPYIYNNNLSDIGYFGIQLEDANATIVNNRIHDVSEGINVNNIPPLNLEEDKSNATIIGNTIWNVYKPHPSSTRNAGIDFAGYSIGVIKNNTIYNCSYSDEPSIQGYGILVHGNAAPSEISGNNCSYNRWGMVIKGSNPNLKLTDNTAIGNTFEGIGIQNAANTLIADGNNVTGNYEGFALYGSQCQITNNTILFNTRGIIIGSGSPSISNNIIENNENGVYIPGGASPTIKNNYINWSNLHGIYAKDSSPKVKYNIFSNKEDRTGGIASYFYNCGEDTEITNNEYINSHRGIYLMYTPALVEDNTISLVDGSTSGPYADDTVGIAIYHQSDATVIGNTITGGDRGISIEYDSNATLDDNTVTNSMYYGIFVRNVNETVINNSDITDCGYGIYLYYSSGINITENTIVNGGIFIEGDLLEHWNTHNINNSNTVNGKPVYYWKNQTGGSIPSGVGQVILANSTDITIENQTLNNCSVGIELGFSSNISVNGNYANNSYYGIYLFNSEEINIMNNSMTNDGIFIMGNNLDYWNTHNINNSNIVNGKPVYYWKNQTGGTIPSGAGEVILANCTNVVIDNQTLTNASVGIELGFSTSIWINDTNASNNIYGIYFSNSNESSITYSTILYNDYGISLYYSTGNNIVGDEVTSNLYGISLHHSNENNITWNGTWNIACNITSNEIYGLYISNSDENNISGVNVKSNYYGLYLLNADNNTGMNNVIESNSYDGVHLLSSKHNNIYNNSISSNNLYGIYLSNTDENNISINNITSQSYGIYLSNSDINNITGNAVTNNTHGILLTYSNMNNLTGNSYNSNILEGIYLMNSDDNIIVENDANDNYYGIYLISSNGNVLLQNNASENTEGIFIISSSTNNITDNDVYFNNNGIYIDSSDWNNITGNNGTDNTYGIYLDDSYGNKIGINNLSNGNYGIYLRSSNYNNITNNDFLNNTNYGIYVFTSNNNSLIDNDLYDNLIGIEINETSEYHNIYHNNLNNTNTNAIDDGENNNWDNGLEGNWWSDNLSPTDTDGDGICDANYTGTSFVDNYPLANEDNDRVLVEDPWFWFIQSAINYAKPGDTAYARSDTYLENLSITKTFTIIGNNSDDTIIDGRGIEKVISIDDADYVKITGFTVKNGTYIISAIDSSPVMEWNTFIDNADATGGFTTYFNTCGDSTKITNNTFTDSFRAIYLMNTSALVRDNNIDLVDGQEDMDDAVGIAVYHDSNASIINNTISKGDSGIRVEYDSDASVVQNRIDNASYYGIFIRDAPPLISQNVLENNNIGTRITQGASPVFNGNWINWSNQYGIYANDSTPIIEWNSFRNKENRTGGISSYFHTCSNDTEIKNNTYINSHRAVYLMYTSALVRDNNITLVEGINDTDDSVGIAVYHESNATVINNYIIDGDSGIRIEYNSNATIINNRIYNASYYGFYTRSLTSSIINDNEVASNNIGICLNYSSGLTITYIDISSNQSYGFFLNYSNNNLIYRNNIISNSTHAYDNTNNSNQWDNGYPLGGNYWSDYAGYDNFSGPSQNISGGDGIGDTPYVIDADSQDDYPLMKPIIDGRIQRPSFRIDSNADFDASHGVVSGSGIESDPWIIEKYDINGSVSGYCLYIGNTTDYFILRDSNLHDADGMGILSSGLSLYNVTNGTIIDNTIHSNSYDGINVQSSSNNTIEDNFCLSNQNMGIYLEESDWNDIIGNNASLNTANGIYLLFSSNNNITSNTALTHEYSGILFLLSDKNNISGNYVADNEYGIYLLAQSNNNSVYDNDVVDNEDGIFIWSSSDNIITDNYVSNNAYGIHLYLSSNNNEIKYNDVFLNNNTGIYLNQSGYNIMDANNIYDNIVGLNLYLSDNNSILYNSVNANIGEGILIDSSDDITVKHNTVSNCNIGVHILESSDITIENSSITENNIGVQLYNSSSIIQYNNISHNTDDGIGDIYYSNAIIRNNLITYNNQSGISNILYSNGIIDNNTISNNLFGIHCGLYSSPIITYNNITSNSIGILSADGSNATIHWNNIHNNTEYGVNNLDSSITIDATYNWWGNSTGPYHPITNPSGSGDRVSDYVDYNPWELAPIDEAGPQ